MPLWVKAALMWLVLLVLMMANGALRVLVLEPRLGEHLARQTATLSGIVVVLACTAPFVRALGELPSRQLLGIGVAWLVLTLTFELPFGHYGLGKSWPELLADYDLAAGRLWPLFLLATLLAPWLWGRILGMARREAA